MKKLFFILSLITVTAAGTFGQQLPLYTQYYQDPMIYNPARTGWEGRYNLNFIYRRQFQGIQNGPETRALTFDMPVMSNKAGVGMYVYDDVTNIFHRTAGYLSYAYHINFKDDSRLSIGLSAGVQSVRVDAAKIVIQDPSDPLIVNGRTRSTIFDGNFGINYFYKGWNLGLSALQLLGTDISYLNNPGINGYSPRRTYVAATSYDIKLIKRGEENLPMLTITPMAMFRTTEALDWQVDAGLSIMFKDWIWINSMYRYNYGVSVGGGFKIHDLVKIGYTYDLPLSEIKNYTMGNHEFFIGLTIPKRKKGGEGMADSTLAKKLSTQDSLMQLMQNKLDSVNNKTDSLGRKTDSIGRRVDTLGSRLDSLAAFTGLNEPEIMDENDSSGTGKGKGKWKGNSGNDKLTQKQIDDLKRRLDELEQKYGKNLDDMKKVNDKNKQALNEMQEERTRVVDEKDLEYKRGVALGNYFMVVGSFRIEQNSYKFQDQLDKEKFKAGVVYDKKRKWYYVYLSQPENRTKGLEELYKLREENPRFHDAWIHIMSKAVR